MACNTNAHQKPNRTDSSVEIQRVNQQPLCKCVECVYALSSTFCCTSLSVSVSVSVCLCIRVSDQYFRGKRYQNHPHPYTQINAMLMENFCAHLQFMKFAIETNRIALNLSNTRLSCLERLETRKRAKKTNVQNYVVRFVYLTIDAFLYATNLYTNSANLLCSK